MPMFLIKCGDGQITYRKVFINIDHMRGDGRFIKMPRRHIFKNVTKAPFQIFQSPGIAVNIDRLARHPVDAAQIINTVDVIGVEMRVENGIQFL